MKTQTNIRTQAVKKLTLHKESICLLNTPQKTPIFGPTAVDWSVTCG